MEFRQSPFGQGARLQLVMPFCEEKRWFTYNLNAILEFFSPVIALVISLFCPVWLLFTGVQSISHTRILEFLEKQVLLRNTLSSSNALWLWEFRINKDHNYEKEKTFLPYSYMICILLDRTVENMAAKFVRLWTYFHENYTLSKKKKMVINSNPPYELLDNFILVGLKPSLIRFNKSKNKGAKSLWYDNLVSNAKSLVHHHYWA